MSTSSSSSSSLATLVAPPTFTGVSNFASSLQQVLSRAVAIASLPLQSDQVQLNSLTTDQGDLQGLDTVFTTLQQSLSSLQSTVSSNLLTSSVSNSSASATVSSGASAGTYTLEVDSLGSFSSALSSAGSAPVSDPTKQGISDSTTFTLSVGGNTQTITAASSNLQDLAAAVNSQAGGQVQATLVNVGSSNSPDYRLSLQAQKLGSDAIDLTDSSGNDLVSTSTPGSLASYKVNGLPTSITSDTRTITLSTGLTVNLLSTTGTNSPATITVSNNAGAVASAFSSFAGSYNAAVDVLQQYHGQNAGALEGDNIIQSLTSVLNQIGTYSNGSPASALANYGVTLDQNGQLSVDEAAFTHAANTNFSALLNTLGGNGSGGFLDTASSLLDGIENSQTGSLKMEENSVAGEITSQQSTIKDEQDRVIQLQTNLTQQISLADASIAQLESQVSYVTGLFAQYTGANNTQSNGLSTL